MKGLWYAGIDVSQRRLDVAIRDGGGKFQEPVQFDNHADGHRALGRWLTKRGRSVRVVIESTGVYSLDLALALHQTKRVEVMVANPRATRQFAEARLQRSRTDGKMAMALAEFAARMEFRAWEPPAKEVRDLRAIGRRMEALTEAKVREHNRLHAAQATEEAPEVVLQDIRATIEHLESRIAQLELEAKKLIESCPRLKVACDRLLSIKGFGLISSIYALGELLVLPAEMTAPQWAAHCGLDVRHVQSGTSVRSAPRISKQGNAHVRRALYMPAAVAIRHEPHVRLFYEQLLARGKQPLQAIVAVMRKLLHAIWGMLKYDRDFDGAKFRRMHVSQTA
jgi:transposase